MSPIELKSGAESQIVLHFRCLDWAIGWVEKPFSPWKQWDKKCEEHNRPWPSWDFWCDASGKIAGISPRPFHTSPSLLPCTFHPMSFLTKSSLWYGWWTFHWLIHWNVYGFYLVPGRVLKWTFEVLCPLVYPSVSEFRKPHHLSQRW